MSTPKPLATLGPYWYPGDECDPEYDATPQQCNAAQPHQPSEGSQSSSHSTPAQSEGGLCGVSGVSGVSSARSASGVSAPAGYRADRVRADRRAAPCARAALAALTTAALATAFAIVLSQHFSSSRQLLSYLTQSAKLLIGKLSSVNLRGYLTLYYCGLSMGFGLMSAFLIKSIKSFFPSRVYLYNFSIFVPPKELLCSKQKFVNSINTSGIFPEDSLKFQERLIERSGLGDRTYLPLCLTTNPPKYSMELARQECEMVFTGCLDDLFKKTGLGPKDIDILIVTCSLFNPTPSIASMIINKYKMKSTIKSFNMSGMGCSAGILAIGLAKDLLKVHKNSNCLLFAHENITMNYYFGAEKSMLLPNVLFRVGGACTLLTNKPELAKKSIFRLENAVRVNTGASDSAYYSIYQKTDPKMNVGVELSRDLVAEVGKAMTKNLTILGPSVLPLSEQIKYVICLIKRKLSKQYAAEHPQYTPNFKKAFNHFCIHCGGRAVLDGVQKNLDLSDSVLHPFPSSIIFFFVCIGC
eukprot:TRINITY_DN3450_c1_g1_i1.p2 TRINITY_DN3450_c1_g1~~TRINITY_DN3450_c1_g1_i1.p2  ORF type:complete len:525 (-),score=128.39 TRINITY_DN3450_c1_g1_i1:1749-3323(-)